MAENCSGCGYPLPDVDDHPDAPWEVTNGVGGTVLRFHGKDCLIMYGQIRSDD